MWQEEGALVALGYNKVEWSTGSDMIEIFHVVVILNLSRVGGRT